MHLSASAFLWGFAICYSVVFSFELFTLGYYPLTAVWSFADRSLTDGTVMHWYGLLITSIIAGLVFSLASAWLLQAVKPTSSAAFSRRFLPILPVWLLMLQSVWLLRDYFF